METPFFNYQRKPRPRFSSPKVVSIPVQFITSQKSQTQSQSESSAALKIQKVFRARLVRKNVIKIMAIKRQVDEIEEKLSETEFIQLIRKDSKERIRINETLMSLLFKLDSISGVNSVVRDCRKSVIRKAVGLQERVDQIAEMKDSEECEGQNVQFQGNVSDDRNLDFVHESDPSLEIDNSVDPNQDFVHTSDQSPQIDNSVDENLDLINNCGQFLEIEKSVDENLDFGVESKVHSMNSNDFNTGPMECSFDSNYKSDLEKENVCDDVSDLAVESEGDTLKVDEFGTKISDFEDDIDGEDCIVKEIVEDVNVKGHGNGKGGGVVEEENEDKKRNRELLEKMAMENEKMMSLMSKLCDKNEMQTKMLNSLAQRVDKLEKALMCEKLRRKKKRNSE